MISLRDIVTTVLEATSATFPVHCQAHGVNEVWVVCTHLDRIRSAKLLSKAETGVDGEALCDECQTYFGEQPKERPVVPAGGERELVLQLACGACVREHWPIEGAN